MAAIVALSTVAAGAAGRPVATAGHSAGDDALSMQQGLVPTCNPFGAGVPLAEAVRHRGLLWFHTCLNLLHTGRAVQQLAQRGRLRLARVLELELELVQPASAGSASPDHCVR